MSQKYKQGKKKKKANNHVFNAPTGDYNINIQVDLEEKSIDIIFQTLNLIVLVAGFAISIFMLNESIKQNKLSIDNLKEQQNINLKTIEAMNLDKINKPLLLDLDFDYNVKKQIDIVFQDSKEIKKAFVEPVNFTIIQGNIKSIKSVYADNDSFGIEDIFKGNTEFPALSQMQIKKTYHTGETSNYDFARLFLIVEGRDLSRHFYMLAYQIDKKK